MKFRIDGKYGGKKAWLTWQDGVVDGSPDVLMQLEIWDRHLAIQPIPARGDTMTIGPAPICLWCKRYREGRNWGDPNTCEAFAGGIPDEIQVGGFDHRKPFDGDNGIRFQAREDIPMDWSVGTS